MTRSISPGLRAVLVDLARFDASEDEDVRSALRALDDADWAHAFELAGTHRVLANLSRIVAAMPDAPPLSKHLARRLVIMLRRQAAARRWESASAIAALTAAGVDAVVLKGYVLGIECYPEFPLRETGDLDLLVAGDDVARAAAVLEAEGFERAQIVPATGEVEQLSSARLDGYADELQHLGEFTRVSDRGTGLTIDLHFRLSTVFDHLAPDTSVFLTSAQRSPDGTYLRFSPELMVAHLGYHAWWDTQSLTNVRSGLDLRLFQYSDILLAFRAWGLDCRAVLDAAEPAGVAVSTNWALWMTSAIFGDLPGSAAIDVDAAIAFDARFSDRWLQRETGTPLGEWDVPGPDRIFDAGRGARATAMIVEWIDGHTKRGDVLSWIVRDEQ